ncbi:MAG: hypothetical protein Q9227_004172 [Pyrenula ochraceoflavens]
MSTQNEAPAWSAEQLLSTMLDVVSRSIVPAVRANLSTGSKFFGAAVLEKSSLKTFLATSNFESKNPLLHAEVHAVTLFYEQPPVDGQRPPAKDCVFVTTHEPCSLCLSAITWAGFDNFYYLFTYEDTKDAFGIPHDLDILHEVFRVPAQGESPDQMQRRAEYNRQNKFFTAISFADLVEQIDDTQKKITLKRELERIKTEYLKLGDEYQHSKKMAKNPNIPYA